MAVSEKLTREHVMSLQVGRDLDALVAREVMGWVAIDENEPYRFHLDRGGVIVNGRPEKFTIGEIPVLWLPSREISASWDVVNNRLDRAPYHFIANNYDGVEGAPLRERPIGPYPGPYGGMEIQSMESHEWFVAFAWHGGIHLPGEGCAKGMTLPLAICRAALMTVIEP